MVVVVEERSVNRRRVIMCSGEVIFVGVVQKIQILGGFREKEVLIIAGTLY